MEIWRACHADIHANHRNVPIMVKFHDFLTPPQRKALFNNDQFLLHRIHFRLSRILSNCNSFPSKSLILSGFFLPYKLSIPSLWLKTTLILLNAIHVCTHNTIESYLGCAFTYAHAYLFCSPCTIAFRHTRDRDAHRQTVEHLQFLLLFLLLLLLFYFCSTPLLNHSSTEYMENTRNDHHCKTNASESATLSRPMHN